MTETLTAQPMEVPQLTPEQDQEIYEALDYGTPREAQARLARYTVQKALRLDFTKDQHIYCAIEQKDRRWPSRIKKILAGKYKDANGFEESDLEIESMMLGVEEYIND